MKISRTSLRGQDRREQAWALLAVMTLAACALLLLASVMIWANTNSTVTSRNNEYFATSYAAEAATEKALSAMSQEYQNYGLALVNDNMTNYATNVPNTNDGVYWSNYVFSGGGVSNQILVSCIATNATNILPNNTAYSAYAGLTMVGNTYQIIASAQNTTSPNQILCTVGQQVNLGIIPLFQFAIFYEDDLEFCPGVGMTINGPVHGNANLFLVPDNGLTFSDSVTAVGSIFTNQSPNDPTTGRPTSPAFNYYGAVATNEIPLNLPVGTNNDVVGTNSANNAYGILALPQAGQTPGSAGGSNLLYNQVDMIIIISNNGTMTVTSGAGIDNQTTIIPSNQWGNFINTNTSFTDLRDNLVVNPVVIDVSNLVVWSATNTLLNPVLAGVRPGEGNVQSIYVNDMRPTSNGVVSYSVTTNTNLVTTVSFPSYGSYAPPVTTNAVATNNTYAQGLPGNGTYLGSVTNDTQATTNGTKPGAGSYVGSITNIVITNTIPNTTNYAYAAITGYDYALITGYTYNGISMVTNAVTNWGPQIYQPGIVLSNGTVLPPQGLSVATPDPAYVVGNWNVQLTNSPLAPSDAGLNQVGYTLPSAIYADAITVLSSAWNPANSTAGIGSRFAVDDTVTAAFFMGNVASTTNGPNAAYSGGVENFPRFLEDWHGRTFTYNGSMVQMFNSHIATNKWPGTGSVYNAPIRNWAYDTNFENPAQQPPLTPKVIVVQRCQWSTLSPGATSMLNVSTY